MNSSLVLILKGMLMGTSDTVPGVSGGTVAFVLGIYSQLVDAIKAFRLRPFVDFIFRRITFRQAFEDLHFPFLLPLLLGIFSAFIVASKFIPQLLHRFPAQMNALFFGLILASIYVPLSRIKGFGVFQITIICVFAFLAYEFVGLPALNKAPTLLFTFTSGAIAICAMILPGISGSFMLKALGQYEFMLVQLHSAFGLNLDALSHVVVFLLGALCGLKLFAGALSYLLHQKEQITMLALTGLMIGALRAVWPFKNAATLANDLPRHFGELEIACLFLFALGIFVTSLLIFSDRRHQTLRAD